MKKIWKVIIGSAATLAIFFLLMSRLMGLVERKASYIKYEPFYEQKEDFDVLFMGSSHVVDGIFPMELWNDYGIVSYNFGGYGNRLATAYWVMKDALQYTSPELMVIDCYLLESNRKRDSQEEYLHQSFDHMALDKTKIEGIKDIIPNDYMEYLWPFISYHNRWQELKKMDFDIPVTTEKGARMVTTVGFPQIYEEKDWDSVLEEETKSIQYLKKMIEECQSRDIEVLLVYLPFSAGIKSQTAANSVYPIAEEYGVDYLNFLRVDGLVNYSGDFADQSHLNASGARKVTDYLGQYIEEHFDLEDQRENASYAGWYEDYEKYTEYKISTLQSQQEVYRYLMLLQDKRFSHCIYLKAGSITGQNEIAVRILENEGIDRSRLTGAEDLVIAVDYSSGEVSYPEPSETIETDFGTFHFEDADSDEADTIVAVIDNQTKETVDTAKFKNLLLVEEQE